MKYQNAASRPDLRFIVSAGVLFLIGGILVPVLLNDRVLLRAHELAARHILSRPLEGLLFFQSVPDGVEFGIRAVMLAFSTLLLEAGFVGWPNSSMRGLIQGERRVRRDFIFMLLCAVLAIPVLSGISSFGLTYAVAGMTGYAKQFELLRFVPSVVLQFIVLVLARSLAAYWQHRMAHHVPFLWQLHKFHHSPTQMTGLNDYRGTPLTIAITGGFALIVTHLMGSLDRSPHNLSGAIAAGLFLVYLHANELHVHFLHTKVNLTYGSLGRCLLVSPGFHLIHHTSLPEYRNKNYATDFVIWDWMFGTYVDPAKVPDRANIPLGYEGNTYDKASWAYDFFLRPPVEALASLLPRPLRADDVSRRVRSVARDPSPVGSDEYRSA